MRMAVLVLMNFVDLHLWEPNNTYCPDVLQFWVAVVKMIDYTPG
jgi:hypothetical protein